MEEVINFEFMDLSTITLEKKPTNRQIYVTKNRKDFLKHLFKPLESEIREDLTFLPPSKIPNIDPNKLRFLLLGNEGIGKTITLGLLAHVLKTSAVKDKIKVFYIQDCEAFMENPYEKTREEINLVFQGENIGNFDISENYKGFFDLVEKYNKLGYLTVFIADQLNSLENDVSIPFFKKLVTLPWKMQIYSQSSTNFLNDDFKMLFRTTINCTCEKFFTEKIIKKLIEEKCQEINLILKVDEDDEVFQKIYDLVKENPREINLILESKGNTIEEKIEKYKFDRSRNL